ncbi:sensor histidine kinase [Corynebacterium sp. HMSC05E07]|uniref:sensor histidine kinase n=1 Tax=Corynebacterium sp. HMSC05E07 TaxID=1581117 RepID=UPI0008A60709|nr:histidine kinase [Corynebacterium sp. HMSC05E07]OFT59710.1 hypothetical protein HMPREF3149_09640 [Corynebacterium sp. HMSC05E07]
MIIARLRSIGKWIVQKQLAEVVFGLFVIVASLFIFPGADLGNLGLQMVGFLVLVVIRLYPGFSVVLPLFASGLWYTGMADHTLLSGVLAYIAIEFAVARGCIIIAVILAVEWLVFGYVVSRDFNPQVEDLPGVLFELLCFGGAFIIGQSRASIDRKQKHQVTQQKQLQHELRINIARYLHDSLARTLTMISMHSELARMDTNSHEAEKHLNDIAEAGRSAIEDLRQLVEHLINMQPSESGVGLGAWNTSSVGTSISESAKLLRDAGYRLAYTGISTDMRFPRTVETAFALALNEVIANLVKHAPPNAEVEISAIAAEKSLIVVVANSCSRSENSRLSVGAGVGVDSILSRMASIGGDARFVSDTDYWQVILSIPITNEKEFIP